MTSAGAFRGAPPLPKESPQMRTLSVAALAVLCSAGVAAGTSGSYPKLSFLYESDEAVRAMIGGSEAMRNLNWVYRVEPSNSAPDTKFVGGDTQRASKYNGRALAALAAPDMAAELMRVIDDS